jgi:hypothetical protein
VAYAQGDVNTGVDPNISGGSYTNNFVGATSTIFYGLDFNLGTLITIAAPLTATGSSNTGGGQLQTIGPIVNASGNPINITPIADIDIYTDGNKVNTLIMVSNRKIYTIDLAQINPALPLGQTQKVVANGVALTNDITSTLIDIAVATPTGAAPAPAPTATPTPTPTPKPTPTPAPTATTYQAENAYIGGGGKVDTIHPGFTGTGFVDYADNVANSFVEFTVKQTGTRTLIFRYGNGSKVNRPTSIKVNGYSVGTLTFPPTGSWPTWKTVSIKVNLGSTAGAKVRVTSTTNAGGPNLDKMDVQ